MSTSLVDQVKMLALGRSSSTSRSHVDIIQEPRQTMLDRASCCSRMLQTLIMDGPRHSGGAYQGRCGKLLLSCMSSLP